MTLPVLSIFWGWTSSAGGEQNFYGLAREARRTEAREFGKARLVVVKSAEVRPEPGERRLDLRIFEMSARDEKGDARERNGGASRHWLKE